MLSQQRERLIDVTCDFCGFASQIASWPFLFLSLEFCQIWKSCYSCDILQK